MFIHILSSLHQLRTNASLREIVEVGNGLHQADCLLVLYCIPGGLFDFPNTMYINRIFQDIPEQCQDIQPNSLVISSHSTEPYKIPRDSCPSEGREASSWAIIHPLGPKRGASLSMVENGFDTGLEAPNTINSPTYEMSRLPGLCENTRYYLSELAHKRRGYHGRIASIPVILYYFFSLSRILGPLWLARPNERFGHQVSQARDLVGPTG